MTVVVALGMALMLASAMMIGATRLWRGTEKAMRQLDDERESPLYCHGPLVLFLAEGPRTVVAPDGRVVPCLPPAIDHGAGQRIDATPDAICALLAMTGRSLGSIRLADGEGSCASL